MTVTDVDERPERPAAPGVDATAGSTTSLDVSWIRPGRNGGPPIIGYELRYRRGGGAWSDRPHAGTGTSTAIDALETDASYQVQVRALNDETPSEWSPTGTGRTAEPESALIRWVAVVNGPGADGVWTTGERVEVEVRYSLPVAVEQPDCWTYEAAGTCRPPGPFVALVFRTGGHPGYGYGVSHAVATYEGGSGTRVLRFAYTVGAAEDGAGGAVGGGRRHVPARRDDPHARGRRRRLEVHEHAGDAGHCGEAGRGRVDSGRQGTDKGQVRGSGVVYAPR